MTTPQPPVHRRFITLEEANRMLPLVRRVVADLGAAARLYERTQNKLDSGRDRGLNEDERRIAEAELSDHADRLEGCLQELRSLGVEFKGWEGLVDFPAWVDGREIQYCWKIGEGRVEHWHELYAGYDNRKPLPVTSMDVKELNVADAALESYAPDETKTSGKRTKSGLKPVRRADDMC